MRNANGSVAAATPNMAPAICTLELPRHFRISIRPNACSRPCVSNVSIEHEAPLDVMRQRPEVILDLLHVVRKDTASATSVELMESELVETTPSVRRADLVAKVRDAHGAVVGIVVIEVQREKDEAKVRSWPLYVAHLATAHRAPVTLLVLTFDPKVARWARKRRHLGPNLSFAAIAIGPDDLPTINSIDDVLARRDLSVLTALVHFGRRRARTANRFAQAMRWPGHGTGAPLE